MSTGEHDDLVAAGLYDPASSDAARRLELLLFLLDEVGASIPEIVKAAEEDRLLSIAAFRAIRPEGRLTLREAAAEAGVTTEFAAQVWRAAGFPDPRPFERRFGPPDVAMFDLLRIGSEFVSAEGTLQLVRAIGQATAQIAETEIALVRSTMEAPLSAQERWVDIARGYRDVVTALFPRVVEAMDTVHRHQVDAIARRYVGSTPNPTNVVPLAVGFADLCGFTGLSVQLAADDLGRMLAQFEAITGDAVAAVGANVVKRIGDALMFVTNAPGVACALALDLIENCAAARLPKLRAGVTFGDVIVRQGDFYGPVVNLAARLVAEAEPGTALTDGSLQRRLERVRGRYAFLPAGRLNLRGFDDPIDAYQLLRP
ncbi:MAG: adenylate/guanylate cyclase domain-containing protein [Actinomycetota bacterium]|nr:adenylate/guanylate cyclase domain-containing protein [Actinomycetota bacterium]